MLHGKFRKLILAVAGFSVLSACILGGGTEGVDGASGDNGVPRIRVRVMDSTGSSLKADTVYWSYYRDSVLSTPFYPDYPAEMSDSTRKGADRVDGNGTVWDITDFFEMDSIYVTARYVGPDTANLALCFVLGYTQKRVGLNPLPEEINLVMKRVRYCE